MHVTHNEQDLKLRVVSLTWEAEGVLSVELQQLDCSKLPTWSAGAHIDLKLRGIVRQYSLSGSPAEQTSWRISVLREPESGGGSIAVHEALRPGEIVDVCGPRNNFPLAEAPEFLFIAGGIGITPILPMIEEADASGANWRLVYGGRTRSSMAFVKDLERYGDAVQFCPEDEFGRLDLEALLDSPRPNTLVYCCGPEPLLAAVEQRCQSWPSGSLHVERFKAKSIDASAQNDEIEFELVCNLSGLTITVPPGKAILESVEAAGVFPPNSCREGICGTCETWVLEGEPDHRDSILSEQERQTSESMMICVGRSRSPRLVLDL